MLSQQQMSHLHRVAAPCAAQGRVGAVLPRHQIQPGGGGAVAASGGDDGSVPQVAAAGLACVQHSMGSWGAMPAATGAWTLTADRKPQGAAMSWRAGRCPEIAQHVHMLQLRHEKALR